jgi:hypothetical protein
MARHFTYSEASRFGERIAAPVADDDVIHDLYIHQAEQILQAAGDEVVGGARIQHPGWMVVREDHGSGVVQQGLAQNLSRVHLRAVDRAAEQLL